VNNGPIYVDTIPGSISNDIEYTFQQPQDLSVSGLYEFKVWLVDNGDDNINNDTIRVIRMNKPAPVVDFSFITQCANTSVPFSGTASVTPGYIDRYEWSFGDSTYGLGQNPVHIYSLSNTYQVTLQAYSDQGCFTEISKPVTLLATPDARFTVSNVCAKNPISINNQTVMAGGTGTITYLWDFGDGTTSTNQNPAKTYNTAGTYTILMTATSNNGCWDTLSRTITVNPLPVLTLNLNPIYEVTDGAVVLTASPTGGTLAGPGILNQSFIPVLAGIGNHVVKYFYTSPTTGCSDSLLINVSVIPSVVAPVITTQPSSLTSCTGESAALVVAATGTLPQYQWYLNGTILQGETNDTLLIAALGLNNQGNYTVVVYNDADTITSNTAIITVYPTSNSSETITANFSYNWNGNTYTQSGTYT
ncbi:MAG: PKD domain-containing protein, partial [Bacteroidota bacterium]